MNIEFTKDFEVAKFEDLKRKSLIKCRGSNFEVVEA